MNFKEEIKQYKKHKVLLKSVILSEIPKDNGIYIVGVEKNAVIEIDNKTTAIKECIIKGKLKNMLYIKDELDYKLRNCCDKEILYIGKAESKDNGLRGRICQFINYSHCACKIHRGGRALWQIKNWEDILYLYWYPINNAEKIEKDLLKLHVEEHPYKNNVPPFNKKKFSYPFANWKI